MVSSSGSSVSLNVAASGIKSTSDNLDIAWKWNSYKYMNKRTILCDFCFHSFSGGIKRVKKHQLGITQEVKPCRKIPTDIKNNCKSVVVKRKLLLMLLYQRSLV
jgi:hypothetical protein